MLFLLVVCNYRLLIKYRVLNCQPVPMTLLCYSYRIEFQSEPLQIFKPHPPQHNQSQKSKNFYERSDIRSRGWFSLHPPCPKKDGGQRPLNNFIAVQHWDLLRPGDWLTKIYRFERCLLYDPDHKQFQQKPIHLSPIWPILCTMVLYQNPKPSSSSCLRAWVAGDILHRQH